MSKEIKSKKIERAKKDQKSKNLIRNVQRVTYKSIEEDFLLKTEREDNLILAYNENKLKSKDLIKKAKELIKKRNKDMGFLKESLS